MDSWTHFAHNSSRAPRRGDARHEWRAEGLRDRQAQAAGERQQPPQSGKRSAWNRRLSGHLEKKGASVGVCVCSFCCLFCWLCVLVLFLCFRLVVCLFVGLLLCLRMKVEGPRATGCHWILHAGVMGLLSGHRRNLAGAR